MFDRRLDNYFQKLKKESNSFPSNVYKRVLKVFGELWLGFVSKQ